MKSRLLPLCLLLAALPARSETLQNLLRPVLRQDPAVREAEANADAAAQDIQAARAGHYPVVRLTTDQTVLRHNNRRNRDRKRFNPGIQATLNLYSWSGVESKIRHSEHKHDFYRHKIGETREDTAKTVGALYLSALRAKELIQTARHNLQRHDQIINDLSIIARHDQGRLSELHQAQTRRLRVDAYLAEQSRHMELALSQLGKYTGSRLNPATLSNPFVRDTPDSLVRDYARRDMGQTPSYRAQQAERESVLAELETRKASRYPGINLIANANRDNKEIYISLSWDAYNPAAAAEVEKSAYTLAAAEAKMDQILRDGNERARSSEVDMRQSLKRARIAQNQIAAQKKVVKAYELQFKIARRTLIDVLDAYSELSDIELTAIAAENDFRDAALEYLSSQAAVGDWAQGRLPETPAAELQEAQEVFEPAAENAAPATKKPRRAPVKNGKTRNKTVKAANTHADKGRLPENPENNAAPESVENVENPETAAAPLEARSGRQPETVRTAFEIKPKTAKAKRKTYAAPRGRSTAYPAARRVWQKRYRSAGF